MSEIIDVTALDQTLNIEDSDTLLLIRTDALGTKK